MGGKHFLRHIFRHEGHAAVKAIKEAEHSKNKTYERSYDASTYRSSTQGATLTRAGTTVKKSRETTKAIESTDILEIAKSIAVSHLESLDTTLALLEAFDNMSPHTLTLRDEALARKEECREKLGMLERMDKDDQNVTA